jgi:hypothetical protein
MKLNFINFVFMRCEKSYIPWNSSFKFDNCAMKLCPDTHLNKNDCAFMYGKRLCILFLKKIF